MVGLEGRLHEMLCFRPGNLSAKELGREAYFITAMDKDGQGPLAYHHEVSLGRRCVGILSCGVDNAKTWGIYLGVPGERALISIGKTVGRRSSVAPTKLRG